MARTMPKGVRNTSKNGAKLKKAMPKKSKNIRHKVIYNGTQNIECCVCNKFDTAENIHFLSCSVKDVDYVALCNECFNSQQKK